MIARRARWPAAAASGLLFVLTQACGEPEETATRAPEDAQSAGAEAAPLIDPSSVGVAQVFELGDAEISRSNLRQPRDLALEETGALYVLDYEAPAHAQVVAYDSEGAFSFRFGEKDDRADRVGPADQFAVMPWKYVMFVDGLSNALTSFLTLGTYVSTAGLAGVGMAVLPVPEYGHFYLKKWDPARRRAYVVHMQLPVDSLGMVYEVSLPPGQSVRKDARDVSFRTASDAQGRLYVAFADVYQVRVLGADGATVRVIQSSRPAVSKSPRKMEQEREELMGRLRRQVGDVSDSLLQEAATPDTLFPLVEELSVDPAGRLWVRTHRPERAGGTVYDVFNEQGQLISWVAVPAVVRRTAFSPDGRLFVIDEQDPERPRIVGYEVRFAPAAATAEIADG